MCAGAIWVCYTRRPFKKYRVLGRFWHADWELMRKLLVIGLPISGGFMLEWGLFSSAALLVGWIGTTALAAHQIALQVATLILQPAYARLVNITPAIAKGQLAGLLLHCGVYRMEPRAADNRMFETVFWSGRFAQASFIQANSCLCVASDRSTYGTSVTTSPAP